MMDVKELEVEIVKEKAVLLKLEEAYEKEEDGNKASKLEYQISRKEEQIDKLIDRQQKLLDREAEDEEKENAKDKDAEEEDTDVCESCGGDLMQVGTSDEGDIFECVKCKELYLDN